jgi:hypothetical protein
MADWQEHHPAVHGALAPEYRGLAAEQVEAILAGALGEGATLAWTESCFESFASTLSGVANVAAQALPGVLAGAMGGAALGPAGMIAGGLMGGAGAALGAGGAAGRPRAAARPGVARPAAGVAPAAGAAAAGPAPAVGQFLAALGSPTVQQALLAMLLGAAGNKSVPTAGDGDVPVAAVTNMLGTLAAGASAEWEEIAPSVEAERIGETFDFAAPQARAAWLFERLVPIAGSGEAVEMAPNGETSDEGWLDELYDEFEAELMTGEEPQWTS